MTTQAFKSNAMKRCSRQYRQVETACHQVDSCNTTMATQENDQINRTFERDRGRLRWPRLHTQTVLSNKEEVSKLERK